MYYYQTTVLWVQTYSEAQLSKTWVLPYSGFKTTIRKFYYCGLGWTKISCNWIHIRVAQYQFFFINSISIILFPFLSIPISMSINIKRAYQYQCVINYWKVPLSISISMSINWLPYQYQYQYFNSYQNLLKSVHVWNLCIIKQGSTAEIVRQR